LDLVRPYKFAFSHEKWFVNLLLVGVGLAFVPIVGHIVIMGYMFGQIERWHRRKDDSNYEEIKVTSDSLMGYLTRGCWPFLVQFAIQQCLLTPISLGFGIYVATQMPRSG